MNTKDIRKQFGLTQKQLAEILGIKVKKVQNWDQRDSMDDLVHLLTRFQLYDLRYMYDEEGPEVKYHIPFAEYARLEMKHLREVDADLPELKEEE